MRRGDAGWRNRLSTAREPNLADTSWMYRPTKRFGIFRELVFHDSNRLTTVLSLVGRSATEPSPITLRKRPRRVKVKRRTPLLRVQGGEGVRLQGVGNPAPRALAHSIKYGSFIALPRVLRIHRQRDHLADSLEVEHSIFATLAMLLTARHLPPKKRRSLMQI